MSEVSALETLKAAAKNYGAVAGGMATQSALATLEKAAEAYYKSLSEHCTCGSMDSDTLAWYGKMCPKHGKRSDIY